jgi:hypothetical protein
MVISMLRRRELKNPQRYDRAGRHLTNSGPAPQKSCTGDCGQSVYSGVLNDRELSCAAKEKR